MKKYMFLTVLALTGCTNYSVTMNHTEGQASDLIDETSSQSQTPTVTANPNISVPASIIPK